MMGIKMQTQNKVQTSYVVCVAFVYVLEAKRGWSDGRPTTENILRKFEDHIPYKVVCGNSGIEK